MSARARRRALNLRLDWLILFVSFVTFATGFVLFTQFHKGSSAYATSALGCSKLFWLNAHRFSALALVLAVSAHVGLHWRVFRLRLANVVRRGKKKALNADLVMYVAFFVATLTSLVAWWLLDGSSPVFGTAIIGPWNPAWHSWLDVHQFASVVSMVLIVLHIKHRWRFMARIASAIGR